MEKIPGNLNCRFKLTRFVSKEQFNQALVKDMDRKELENSFISVLKKEKEIIEECYDMDGNTILSLDLYVFTKKEYDQLIDELRTVKI